MISVFVVEDEPFILNAIKEIIEETDNRLKVIGQAMDGIDALPLIEALKPDVVFTDIRMPIMDGLTLIDHLKEKNIQTISVILSSYQEFEYAKKAMHHGVFEYLLKPLSDEVLKITLSCLYNESENADQVSLDNVEPQNEKSLKVLIQNKNAEKIKQAIKMVLETCEQNAVTQISLVAYTKNLFSQITSLIGEVPAQRKVDMNIEINELISTSINYVSLYER